MTDENLNRRRAALELMGRKLTGGAPRSVKSDQKIAGAVMKRLYHASPREAWQCETRGTKVSKRCLHAPAKRYLAANKPGNNGVTRWAGGVKQ